MLDRRTGFEYTTHGAGRRLEIYVTRVADSLPIACDRSTDPIFVSPLSSPAPAGVMDLGTAPGDAVSRVLRRLVFRAHLRNLERGRARGACSSRMPYYRPTPDSGSCRNDLPLPARNLNHDINRLAAQPSEEHGQLDSLAQRMRTAESSARDVSVVQHRHCESVYATTPDLLGLTVTASRRRHVAADSPVETATLPDRGPARPRLGGIALS